MATAVAATRPGLSRLFAAGSVTAAALAVGALGDSLVSRQWKYNYVADHVRSGASVSSRLGALWAGPEGSLLVWTAIVAVVGLLVVVACDGRWTIRLAGLLVATYGSVLATQANPFERSALPAVDGLGLQPVLENPALLWHPPLLYTGLAGLLYPTLLAVGARLDHVDRTPSTSAIAAPLALLAAGLISGARWAYAEVGWGGYWAWDPIETSGLVAFCAGAAALHGGIRHPVVWALPGLAAIWATTLTRVGLVESVHGFADRPGLRVALLLAASAWSVILLGSSFARGNTLGGRGRVFATVVLLVVAVVAALGTYEPLVEAATTGDRVAIAGRYFSVSLWPVVVAGLAGLVWVDQRRGGSRATGWATFGGALVGVLITPVGAGVFGQLLAAGGGAMVVSSVGAGRRDWSRAAAHAGVGLLLVGVASTFATEREVATVAVGGQVEIAGVVLEHRGLKIEEDVDTPTVTATALIDGRTVRPSLVSYPLRATSTTEIAQFMTGVDEVQVILLDGTAEVARYRVHRVPGVVLVWLGGVMVAVALAAHSLRRFRARSWSTVDPSSSSDPAVEAGVAARSGAGASSDRVGTAAPGGGVDGRGTSAAGTRRS